MEAKGGMFVQDFKMTLGKQFHRIDGHVSPAKRDTYIQDFGNPHSSSQVRPVPELMTLSSQKEDMVTLVMLFLLQCAHLWKCLISTCRMHVQPFEAEI